MKLSKSLCFLLIAMNIVSCSTPTAKIMPDAPKPSTTPFPIPSQTLSPSLTKTAISTLPPTLKPTHTPVGYILGSISLDNPGEWALIDPKNPLLPELIIPSGKSYELRTDWEAGAITYLYVWGGSGNIGPVVDYQTVRWDNGVYKIVDSEVETTLVSTLLSSIQELYPSPASINTITHTGDYSRWWVEVVGKDGNRVQIFSESNSESAIPWNIIYNGRIYITWNTKILPAITDLFGEPDVSFYPDPDYPSDNLPFSSLGLTNQLTQGFSGLLPISERFSYTYNSKKSIIEGNIDNKYPIITFGAIVNGNITELKNVQIAVGKDNVECPVVFDTQRDTLDVLIYGESKRQTWRFTCSLAKYDFSNELHIPIAMTFATNENEQIITRGELYGLVDEYPDRVFNPIPDNIKSILATDANAVDLMQDHIIGLTEFIGDVDRNQDAPMDGLVAQADLSGQLNLGEKIIRYTLATPVNIDHGKVVRWDLDRNEFSQFLSEVLKNPMVQRALMTEPTPLLNLWYAEVSGEMPELPHNEGGLPPNFSYKLSGCPSLYTGGAFPAEGKPLRGFGFNRSKSPLALQFLMIENKAIPVSLFLSPYNTLENMLTVLTPNELKIENHPPIGRVEMIDTEIVIKWDPEVLNQEDIQAYQEKIQSSKLPFIEYSIGNGYNLEDAVFWILDDGSIGIKQCH